MGKLKILFDLYETMATTFNNWESLASIRAKLNANAGEINWKAPINNPSLTGTLEVNWQNWTSAWTSYTPAVAFWTSTWVSVVFARYKQMWKTCVWGFQINIATPDTSIYFGTISLPVVWPYNIAAWNISVFEGSNYINCTSQIDWTIFTAIKIWWNFSWGFLVIRWSFTYETN